jgi:hypothetical protein
MLTGGQASPGRKDFPREEDSKCNEDPKHAAKSQRNESTQGHTASPNATTNSNDEDPIARGRRRYRQVVNHLIRKQLAIAMGSPDCKSDLILVNAKPKTGKTTMLALSLQVISSLAMLPATVVV